MKRDVYSQSIEDAMIEQGYDEDERAAYFKQLEQARRDMGLTPYPVPILPKLSAGGFISEDQLDGDDNE